MVEQEPHRRLPESLTDIELGIITERMGVGSKGRIPSLTEVGKKFGIGRKKAGRLERLAWDKLRVPVVSEPEPDSEPFGAEITVWLPDSPK